MQCWLSEREIWPEGWCYVILAWPDAVDDVVIVDVVSSLCQVFARFFPRETSNDVSQGGSTHDVNTHSQTIINMFQNFPCNINQFWKYISQNFPKIFFFWKKFSFLDSGLSILRVDPSRLSSLVSSLIWRPVGRMVQMWSFFLMFFTSPGKKRAYFLAANCIGRQTWVLVLFDLLSQRFLSFEVDGTNQRKFGNRREKS